MYVLKGELNSTSAYIPAQLTKDKILLHHIDTLTKINVKIDKCELPTFYWLSKLHKNPFNIKRDFYSDVYTILSWDLSNMDHMRISGTEPSSMILSQTK